MSGKDSDLDINIDYDAARLTQAEVDSIIWNSPHYYTQKSLVAHVASRINDAATVKAIEYMRRTYRQEP